MGVKLTNAHLMARVCSASLMLHRIPAALTDSSALAEERGSQCTYPRETRQLFNS